MRVGRDELPEIARYEPQRCYNFPQLDRRRNAKVDIYQHVACHDFFREQADLAAI